MKVLNFIIISFILHPSAFILPGSAAIPNAIESSEIAGGFRGCKNVVIGYAILGVRQRNIDQFAPGSNQVTLRFSNEPSNIRLDSIAKILLRYSDSYTANISLQCLRIISNW